MTVRFQMDLKGLAPYLEEIARAGRDVDKAAAKAVAAGGDEILDGMLGSVPVGKAPEDPHPGQLMRTLKRSEPVQDGNFVYVTVGMPADADADVARYGNAQEYGYSRGGKNYPPQSYIRRGFDEKKAAARRAEKQALEEEGIL